MHTNAIIFHSSISSNDWPSSTITQLWYEGSTDRCEVISNMYAVWKRMPPLWLCVCIVIVTIRLRASIQWPFFRKSSISTNMPRTTPSLAAGLGLHRWTTWWPFVVYRAQ